MHTVACCVAGSHQIRLRIGAIKAARRPEQCPCVVVVLMLTMSFFLGGCRSGFQNVVVLDLSLLPAGTGECPQQSFLPPTVG